MDEQLKPIKQPPMLPAYKSRIEIDSRVRGIVELWSCEARAIVQMLDAAIEAVEEFDSIKDKIGINYYGRFRGKMRKLRDALEAKEFPKPTTRETERR